MFLMIGVNEDRRQLDFNQVMICSLCGEYGRYSVFVTCSILLLFFIPTFRWNYHYYVETSCCGSIYELDPAVGEAIARGENVEIKEEDLTLIQRGRIHGPFKKCLNCGYETAEDFDFCPKCGQHF